MRSGVDYDAAGAVEQGGAAGRRGAGPNAILVCVEGQGFALPIPAPAASLPLIRGCQPHRLPCWCTGRARPMSKPSEHSLPPLAELMPQIEQWPPSAESGPSQPGSAGAPPWH